MPIWVEGIMIGILCHEHIGPPRQWTVAEEQFAASLADLVSLVVESRDRHRALRALEESEARLATFFQATSEAVIITERAIGCPTATTAFRKLPCAFVKRWNCLKFQYHGGGSALLSP
ncbi:MAG: GAF domain-containing protein [Thermosynechococcus sp.]